MNVIELTQALIRLWTQIRRHPKNRKKEAKNSRKHRTAHSKRSWQEKAVTSSWTCDSFLTRPSSPFRPSLSISEATETFMMIVVPSDAPNMFRDRRKCFMADPNTKKRASKRARSLSCVECWWMPLMARKALFVLLILERNFPPRSSERAFHEPKTISVGMGFYGARSPALTRRLYGFLIIIVHFLLFC